MMVLFDDVWDWVVGRYYGGIVKGVREFGGVRVGVVYGERRVEIGGNVRFGEVCVGVVVCDWDDVDVGV